VTQGRTRVLTTLATFRDKPQGSGSSGTIGYLGLFYHWLDMTSATRRVDWNSELSTIDTALLLAGIIGRARVLQHVRPARLDGARLRRLDRPPLQLGHHAELRERDLHGLPARLGLQRFGRWQGYNEAMIL